MSIQDKFENAGIKLVLVSLGTPLQAKKFVEKTKFTGELCVDPSSDGKVRTALTSNQAVAYSFFKLKRGKQLVVNPHTSKLSQELTTLGIDNWETLVENPETNDDGGITEWAGDPFQIGGTFVLGIGNTCDYVYRSTYAGDHPPLDPLLEAATGKNMQGEEVTHTQAKKWASRLRTGVKWGSSSTFKTETNNNARISSMLPLARTNKEEDDEKEDEDKEDLGNTSTTIWKVTTAVAYGAVVVGICTHLRSLLSFEITYMQETPLIRYWPEFILSQIILGLIAIMYEFFLVPSSVKNKNTNKKNKPVMQQRTISTGYEKIPTVGPLITPPSFDDLNDDNNNNDTNNNDIQDINKDAPLLFGNSIVEFMKVSDIDTKLLHQGFLDGVMDNDSVFHSMEMANTPIVGMSPVPQEPSIVKAANPTCRARGDTWDASLGINEYSVILQYIRKFLAKTHSDIGRSGPVCPFVPKSLRKDALHLTVIRTGKGSQVSTIKNNLINYLKPFASNFLTMKPTTGSARAFKAAIFIFPDITLDQTTECIDDVQVACKPFYVKRGLMLGEFHLRNNQPGLRNENFFPLRTPIPCLAVRHMVPTDLAFLDVTKYDVSLRIEFLESFLDVFGNDKVYKNYNEVIKAKEILKKAKNEIVNAK